MGLWGFRFRDLGFGDKLIILHLDKASTRLLQQVEHRKENLVGVMPLPRPEDNSYELTRLIFCVETQLFLVVELYITNC